MTNRTPSFDIAVPVVSTVVPRRGRTAKTVRHEAHLPFSIPVLNADEAPVVASFAGRKGELSEAYPSGTGWDLRGVRFDRSERKHLRASQRDLPAMPLCLEADLPMIVANTFGDRRSFQHLANVVEPYESDTGPEGATMVSSNAATCLGYIRDRMDEMFVTDGVVHVEVPGPVLRISDGRVVNDFGERGRFLQWKDIDFLTPAVQVDGIEIFVAVPPGAALAVAVSRIVLASLDDSRLDLLVRTGDLVRAAGIAQQRQDLYDHVEVRKAVDALHKASHGTKFIGLLKGCLDMGFFDDDIRLDVRRATPEREMDAAAYGVGF